MKKLFAWILVMAIDLSLFFCNAEEAAIPVSLTDQAGREVRLQPGPKLL